MPRPTGKVDPQRTIALPADLAAHDEFANEWWYYAGRMEDENGDEYAFHVSFFKHWGTDERRFGIPVRWVDNPGRFAHGTLANLSSGQRHTHEVVGVARHGTAGARSDRFDVWTRGWSAKDGGNGTHQLSAAVKRADLELTFEPLKPLIIHAGDGTGKPPSTGNSDSYYISSTRMAISGKLRSHGGPTLKVHGTGWFDHEIMGMDVARGGRGWDWFALQLDDRSELVVYQSRAEDGSPTGRTMVALIGPGGARQQLGDDACKIEVLGHWTSPRSGARYPVRWKLSLPSRGIELELTPARTDSELRGLLSRITYWEGFVRVQGTRHGRPLGGHGFVELTGYAKSMRRL